ncbi:MAG TPA: hypothetical protein VGL78_12780 [Solirubrobacteraceae bacterium]|jgi:hypothetical protein
MPRLTRFLLRSTHLDGPYNLYNQALREYGWLRSYRAQAPISALGEPLPWYTYAAIAFLEERLPRDTRVFEYGSGFSTLWYARRVASVTSVESSPEWAERMAAQAGGSQIVTRTDIDAYRNEILAYEEPFDLVAIDGLDRPGCARLALERLSPSGVFVWDNSDREEFGLAMSATLKPFGFRELPFPGLGPTNPYVWRTSIIYRSDNLLGI